MSIYPGDDALDAHERLTGRYANGAWLGGSAADALKNKLAWHNFYGAISASILVELETHETMRGNNHIFESDFRTIIQRILREEVDRVTDAFAASCDGSLSGEGNALLVGIGEVLSADNGDKFIFESTNYYIDLFKKEIDAIENNFPPPERQR